tara:strand:- start:16290 stop:18335 length:2046 start_codon:yes stop_codon:yes gene_type:complete
MAKKNENLFAKLTQLFRSGPVVRRKIKKLNNTTYSKSSLEVFKKNHSDVYNSTLSAYGSYDRMARYSDFSEMEATPEISSALDIYSEECVSPDANGVVLHIHSENQMIKKILSELFYDTLNIDFNLVMWVRNLCKYGDFFLFNDIHPEYGVVNVFPIPIAEMEREEGFDPQDPGAVRFRWVTQGNKVLENWQVSHLRLLGNDAFLPYGSSVLEGARRVWRQLILIEDAMLVYRVIRSPERRVFYIDVGNIPPENIADYLEQAQTSLKRNAVIDKTTGQVDLRYNPLSVDEDYFLPVRGGESGTRIDTLAGGSNTTAIEDVEYIQKKLFAALKIPKAYLGYDEDIGAKATLAQEDIRFSRTIQRIQKTIISELNKIAMIHLYSHGYTDDNLLDFNLELSNPSSIAQQQKLELIRTRFEISGQAPEGMVDKEWIRKNILELNNDEIERIEKGRVQDKLREMELEGVQLPQSNDLTFGDEGGGEDAAGGGDMGGGDMGGLFGGGDEGGGGDEAGGEDAGGLFAGEIKKGRLMSEEELDEYDELIDGLDDEVNDNPEDKDKQLNVWGEELEEVPIKARQQAKMSGAGRENTHDKKIWAHGGALTQDKVYMGKDINASLMDGIMPQSPVVSKHIDKQLSYRMSKDLESMGNSLNIGISSNKLLKEDNDQEYDILIDDNFLNKEDEG